MSKKTLFLEMAYVNVLVVAAIPTHSSIFQESVLKNALDVFQWLREVYS